MPNHKMLPTIIVSMLMLPFGSLAQDAAHPDAVELDEIVVKGEREKTRPASLPSPIQILEGNALAHRRQGGLGETLVGLPGVHLDSFGGGASRPVIRGQTLPRIEILSDGANLFDASVVSPDHAITTEPLLLDAIEILRGPAAIMYGGNAVNGAVNLIDGRIPKQLPKHTITGATEIRLGSGDEEKTGVGRVTAKLGQFALHAEVARRHSGDYDIPGGELKDSFAEGTTTGFGTSWITSKGHLGVGHTKQEAEYGLPGHSHEGSVCHTHGLDLHCEAHGQWTDPSKGWNNDHTARIGLRNERTDLRADYDDLLPGIARLRLRASHTKYAHDEIDGGILFSHYANKADDVRLELTHSPLLGFTGTLGLQYTDSTFSGLNFNTAHIKGQSAHDYVSENIGLFLSERRSFGPVDLEIAVRKDRRTIDIPMGYFNLHEYLSDLTGIPLDMIDALIPASLQKGLHDFYIDNFYKENPPSKHEPLSAAIGADWNLGNGYSVALGLSRSERAPSVRELYAAGNNLATNSLELGLLSAYNFSSRFPSHTNVLETTRAATLTLRKTQGDTQFEIGLFRNDVDDYVFARLIEEETLESGAKYRYLVYTPANAVFTGIDGQISRQFNDAHRLTVFGDYVRATMESEDDHLPRIPPGRLGVRHEWNSGPFSAEAEYYHTFAQDRFASYETATQGYDMLNATLAYRFELRPSQTTEFYVRGNNLLNELAQVHTSFVKEQSPLRGRSLVIGMRHIF